MVEVGLLQHLAQFARANLRVKLLLFLVVVQVVLVRLVMMMGRVIFLALDQLFFNQPGAGRKRRNRRD